jgi:polysaccharide export outer membrane protein
MIDKLINCRFIKLSFVVVLMSLMAASCTPRKKLVYLQDMKESKIDTTTYSVSEDYKFKPKDEVYIQVNSIDPETYTFFNGGSGNRGNFNNSDVSLYLNSYTVNDSGYIAFPVIGEIRIGGLTASAAKDTISKHLDKMLKDYSVTIKLAGFRITVLGEVQRPGNYIAYVSQMNILQALALSGDMTVYGNREKVMVVRKEDGKEKIYYLNLLDQDLIKSKEFNLLPNDIVYIEPLGTKTWGFSSVPYSLLFSSVSTLISILTLVRVGN